MQKICKIFLVCTAIAGAAAKSFNYIDDLESLQGLQEFWDINKNEFGELDFDKPALGSKYATTVEQLEMQGFNVSAIPRDVMEDAFLSAPELIEKYGYNAEVHHVETSDGYILEMHRIVGERSWPYPQKKQPVFVMHGLLASSSCWLLLGPEISLGYLLSDMGYDVWLGNARGNRYSRKHVSLNPDGRRSQRRRFWNFSWHEIGTIDLPAMIDYVLNYTKYEKLHYIGHSQGTTSFFVMASEHPEYNDKILSMQALAPVAYMSNLRSPLLRAAALFLNTLDVATSIIGMYEFLPGEEFHEIGALLCNDNATPQVLCKNIVFLLFGFNNDQMNTTLLPVFFGHLPAGSSTNQVVHYGQGMRSGHFRQYDHGFIQNLIVYGQRRPPNYNVKNIKAPVVLHYGSNDWMADPDDVEQFYKELPNAVGMHNVPHPRFNHIDFFMANDVKTLLYNRVLDYLKKFDQNDLDE